MSVARVSRITLYPVKSLDGIDVSTATVTDAGALLHDRQYAIFDENGKIINGKNTPSIHRLRATFDLEKIEITLSQNGKSAESFHWNDDRQRLNAYLSDFFSQPVRVEENLNGEFLDDPEQSKFTLVSNNSLCAIADHFSISIDECRRRFRANIEVDGVPAFWEESLVRPQKMRVPFKIANVLAAGVKPCPRCVVPSRNPDTGEAMHLFQKEFTELRKTTLPAWTPLETYGNFYQLAISCIFLSRQKGSRISRNDVVSV